MIDPTISATTDQRLLDRGTTEYSCECPALFYKSKVYRCPFTGDPAICHHIYRFRVRLRRDRILAHFRAIVLPALQAAFPKAQLIDLTEAYRPAELERLDAELARQPEPKVKKARAPRAKKGQGDEPAQTAIEVA